MDDLIKGIHEKGWIVIPNFLSESDVQSMNHYFDLHRCEFVEARVGSGETKTRNTEVRGDYTLWIDTVNVPLEFLKSVQFLERLKESLNRNFYLGLKEFECHLASYPVGSFYKKHLDRHKKNSSRVFTFIFYLNQDWTSGNGGELNIYDQNNNLIIQVPPQGGTFVGFMSDEFPHEVLPSRVERRSFTGWIHTKILN